jgi:hypothetical protein
MRSKPMILVALLAGLLLEGIVLRLQADLRWLEACERKWAGRRSES